MQRLDKRIAIIGSAHRFPGCQSQSFEQALLEGQDLVTEVAEDRWSKKAFLHPDPKHPGSAYTFAAGSLGPVKGFDAAFFGLSPREVMHMDPQQRLLLEMTWEAIESSGYLPSALRGSRCGVFIGIASADYGYRLNDDPYALDQNTSTGTTASIAANRISYLFDLHGPSMAIDTACSSAMVAFHQACQALRQGEVDFALAGGISLHFHPFGFMAFSKSNMLSKKNGRCRVFDASADGYVRSEGGGVFLLKPYQAAVADGDSILAVVEASAVNTDGHKSGLTIPNPQAQIQLMREVYAESGISPDQISYLEAHGTGTPVGDPIESAAIGEALGKQRSKPLPIGSVKSNVGHLETASGVAGLAKALVAIKTRQIPATIGISELNPAIPFQELNLDVVTHTRALPQDETLIVGVNSFGFGGANAHVVLSSHSNSSKQPAPEVERKTPAEIGLWVTAASEAGLRARAQQVADRIQAEPQALYDLAWTLKQHQQKLTQGLWLSGQEAQDLVQRLESFAQGIETIELPIVKCGGDSAAPVFVYSGNGCQWQGMGAALLQESELFRQTLEQIDEIFQGYGDFSILEAMSELEDRGQLADTELAQPLLFALQVGITRILQDQGIQPLAVVGHSVGEVAAAWAAGALTLEEAVKVIYFRSHFQGKTAGLGAMTAVALSAEAVQTYLDNAEDDTCVLAGINSSKGVTLAGGVEGLSRVEAALREQGVRFKRLDLNYAFHSPMMDGIEEGVRSALADIAPKATRLPYISTVTGQELAGEALGAEYWWKNIREPVLFAPAVQELQSARAAQVFVEIGAHPVLRSYLQDLTKQNPQAIVVATLERDQQAQRQLLQRGIAQIMASGAAIDWQQWFPFAGQFRPLPAYPWQREEFWLPQSAENTGSLTRQFLHPLLGYALHDQKGVWQNSVDTQLQPWLSEHQVGGGVVFPGAGFIELALAAAQACHPSELLEIEDFEIRQPLLLSEAPSKWIRTSVNSQTGKVSIQSRDHCSDQAWHDHVFVRVLPETAGLSLKKTASPPPLRQPDFVGADLNQAAQALGLEYGPTFSCIREGWIHGQTAIATLEAQGQVKTDAGEYLLHPGILDSAFQLFIALLAEGAEQNLAFVPTQVERMQLRVSNLPITQAEVTLVKRLPHSLLTEIVLFDSSGQVKAALKNVRFRAAPLKKSQTQKIELLNYYLTPAPLSNLSRLPHTLLDKISTAVQEKVAAAQDYQRYSEEVEPLLDAFVEQICLDLAQQAQRFQADRNHIERIEYLARGLRLIDASETWQDLLNQEAIAPDQIWQSILADYPAFFLPAHFIGRRWLDLADRDAEHRIWVDSQAETLLTRENFAALQRARLSQALVHELAAKLGQILRDYSTQLVPGQRLKVAELSADLPLFARHLAPQLDCHTSEYIYLASDETQLNQVQTQFESLALKAFTATSLADNALENQIDLAIMTLDFKEASVAYQHLDNLLHTLSPQGQLILLVLAPCQWLQALDMMEYDPLKTERGSSWISFENCTEKLESLGLSDVQLQPLGGSENIVSALITARKDTAPAIKSAAALNESARILVLGSEQALLPPVQLETPAQADGGWVRIEDVHALTDYLASAAIDQPLELLCLSRFLDPHSQGGAASCVALQALIKQLLASEHPNLGLTLVTQGVGAMFASDQTIAWPLQPTPAEDVALWGFVRSLQNEIQGLRLRLLDAPPATPLATLLQQLLAADAESEVVLTPEFGRMATRLRLEPRVLLESHKTAEKPESKPVELGFSLPGQLRNLMWFEKHLPALQPDEVRVEIKATGLNFRDVMYTLGMLSDEAIENGFAGPSLGLEFSGRVLAVGEGVESFHPGDRVVGFGPASFSSQVNASMHALSTIPETLGYEAAATLPTTFFTVWYALKHLAQLQPGEKVLIHGAAGGVGIAAIQIAQYFGAEIYATAGSDEKRDFLKLMGVKHIYDSRSHLFAEQILADLKGEQGVDVVLNSLAGEAIAQNLRVLKPFGRFLELGKRDFYENTPMGLRPFRNNISYFGIDSDQLMRVKPELTRRLFKEVMSLFADQTLTPLPYTLFSGEQIVDAFRFMQQAKQIGKVVVHYPSYPEPKKPHRQAASKASAAIDAALVNPAGTYLVTGGLSGFGFKSAQWLVEKGARHLVLLSLSGRIDAQTQSLLDTWRQQEIQVHTAACDVADAAALEALLLEVDKTLPKICGVIHAAAVYDDGLALQLDAEQIQRVMRVKIEGAKQLHRLCPQLDMFVLFSSATTLFGNPGQSNYVAANLWLEGFSQWRRQQGLPALCVRWGAIQDAGYLARHEEIRAALQNRMGGEALESASALNLLEELLRTDRNLMAVMELDWSALSRFLPTSDQPKYQDLSDLLDANTEDLALKEQLLMLLEQEGEAAVKQQLIVFLVSELSKILLLPEEQIDIHRSVYEMGFDSLMGVELITALDSRLGIQLPAMALTEASTLVRLSDMLLKKIKGDQASHTDTMIEGMANKHGAE